MGSGQFNYEEDYAKALTVLFEVVQSSIGDFRAMEGWYSHAHALALKLFRHLSTIQHLCVPQLDRTTRDIIVDHSSISSINRTAFETFLTFAYIFGTANRDVSRLRYALWKRSGLMERRRYADPRNQQQENQLATELIDAEDLKREIESSPLFQTEYSEPQRIRLIEKADWTGVHKLPMLAEKAGMHPAYFRKIYKHCSGHAHSNYISAIQVTQARDLPTQHNLASYALGTGLLIMTHFLVMFASMSSQAKLTLATHQHGAYLLGRWHIQREDWERL